MAKATLNFIWRTPKATLIALSCFGLTATSSSSRAAESVNGIAAIVNDKVITYSEVRDVVEPRERLLRSQYSGEELVRLLLNHPNALLGSRHDTLGDGGGRLKHHLPGLADQGGVLGRDGPFGFRVRKRDARDGGQLGVLVGSLAGDEGAGQDGDQEVLHGLLVVCLGLRPVASDRPVRDCAMAAALPSG